MPPIRFGLALASMLLLTGMPLQAQQREQTDSSGDLLPIGAVARLGSVRWRHLGEIAALAFSPDGRLLASGGKDGLVCLWDVASGRLLRSLKHGREVDALAFAADGRRLASAGGSEVSLWVPATGELLDRWPNPFQTQLLVFLKGPERLLSVGDCVGCWNLATGRPAPFLPDWELVPPGSSDWRRCAVSRDKRLLATCSSENIELWDLQAGKRLWRQDRSGGCGVAFCLADQVLVALGADGKLRRRNLATGEEEAALPVMAPPPWMGAVLAGSPDGAWIVSGFWDWEKDHSEHRLIDPVHWLCLPFPEGQVRGPGPRVFSPDGKVLAGGGRDGRIRLWDLPSGKLRRPVGVSSGLPGCVRPAVSLAGNGQVVAFVDSAGLLTLADKDTLKPLRRWTAEEGGFSAVALSANGRMVVTSGQKSDREGGPICFWDPATGHKLPSSPSSPLWIQTLPSDRPKQVIASLALSPDGALAACQFTQGQVHLVETASGKTLRQLQANVGSNATGCFSPDDKLFLAGDEAGRLHVWEVATGKEIHSWLAHGGFFITGFSFSGEGKQLATTAGDGFVAVWEVNTWKRLAWLDRHNCDWAPAALSPDGRLVASRGRNRSLLIWEVQTGRFRWRLPGERVSLSDAVFDRTGRWLLTAGQNDTLLKWDLEQLKDEPMPEPPPVPAESQPPLPPGARLRIGGKPLIPERGEQHALSPDGNVLVEGTQYSGDVQLWSTATGRPLRSLTGAEADPAFPFTFHFWGGGPIFSPDSRLLAAASQWGLSVWDLRTGQRTLQINCRIPDLKTMAFSPDGRFLAVACGQFWQTLQVWDLDKKQPLHESLGKKLSGASLAFSQDGKQLIVCGSCHDKEPEEWLVWDVPSGRCLQKRPFRGRVVGLSPCGRFFAIQEEEKPRAIIDFASGKQLFTLEGFRWNEWSSREKILFARTGQVVGVGTKAGTVEVWDVVRARKLVTIPGKAYLVDLSADGRVAATTSEERERSIQFWRLPEPDGSEGTPVALTSVGRSDHVTALGWTPDSRWLAVGRADHRLRIVQAQTGKVLVRLADPADEPAAVTFSPQGDRLAALAVSGQLGLWQCDSGKLLAAQSSPLSVIPKVSGERWPAALRYSRAGRQLTVLGGKGQLDFWDGRDTGETPGWRPREPEHALAVSSDARLVATLEERTHQGQGTVWQLRLRELPEGDVWAQFEEQTSKIEAAVFSEDSRLLAVSREGKNGHEVALLETATGQEVWCCHQVPWRPSCLAVAPDNSHLAVACGNDEVWVHDLVRRRPVGLLRGHTDTITTVAFSPDGRTLATGSRDCTVLLWDTNWSACFPRPRIDPPLADPEALWRDLSGTDASRGQEALWRLVQVPEQALPLLKRKLQSVESPDGEKLKWLLRDLEHDEFARRDKARQELLRLGSVARPPLRRLLEGKPSADLKRQAEQLLEEIKPEPAAPRWGAASRAVAVLERIGSPEARRLLKRLAEDEATYLAQQAQHTLERLNRGPAKP